MQQIIAGLTKGVVLIDPDQSIIWANDAALVMHGLQDVDALDVTQLCINSAFSVIIGIGLFFIGVPNPILWGILSILLRFVPYVGSFIAAVLLLGLAAAVELGWSMVLWTAALYVVVEGVTGQVIERLVYGHSTGLLPFSVVEAARQAAGVPRT